MKFEDLNILDIGNTIQLAGAIYADGDRVYLIPMPHGLTEEQRSLMTELHDKGVPNGYPVKMVDMTHEDWKALIKQADHLEVEILQHAEENGNRTTTKAIIRKSTRQISQGVSWAVWHRDHFECRYCAAKGGEGGLALTVDHLVLWKNGGPSIESNLVACCRRCNKVRGDLPYYRWLRHPYYKKVSRNLLIAIVDANEALLHTLDTIPRMVHKPKKR